MNARRSEPPKMPNRKQEDGAERRRYRVCAPVEREGQDTFWPRLGTAFVNEGKDGKPATITIRLSAHPLGDTLMLFEDDAREPGAEG